MNFRRRSGAALLACAALLCQALPCLAQSAPDAGSTLRDLQSEPLAPPPPNPPAPRISEPPKAPARPAPEVRFVLKAVHISGNSVFPTDRLLALVQDLVGTEVGFKDLNAAADRVTAFYRAHGYPLARAYLPPQEIREGNVDIAVLEVRFGAVDLDNHSRVRDAVISRFTAGLAGHLVEEGILERQLLLVYDMPGVGAPSSAFHPGAKSGQSDLAIELGPTRAVAGSVEVDNYGNRYSGANRVTGRAQALSPTGYGDKIEARYTKGNPGLEYWRLSYRVPVGGQGLEIGAAQSASSYRLGKDFSSLDASGDTRSTAATASYPFVRSRTLNVYARGDFERRAMSDSIGATATVTDKSMQLFSLAATVDLRGMSSVTVVSLGYTSGRLNIDTPLAQAIDALTAQTAGGFGKVTLNLLRVQTLTRRLTLAASFSAQWASKNLDSSEKFVIGGASGVRGYPAGEAPGDSGYLLRAELRRGLYRPAVPGTIERFVFLDAASVTTNQNPFIAGPNTRQLSALGVGARWQWRGRFRVELALAHKLGSAVATTDTDEKLRGWVQAIMEF